MFWGNPELAIGCDKAQHKACIAKDNATQKTDKTKKRITSGFHFAASDGNSPCILSPYKRTPFIKPEGMVVTAFNHSDNIIVI